MNKKNEDNDSKVEEVNEVEQVESESSELDKCRKRVEELENVAKRALADYQNLEKRVREEKSEWIKISNKNILLRLLPVLDTLQLAKRHVDNQGLTLSIQQFLDILKDEGVVSVQTKDKYFDPHTMECVQTVEGKEGKVMEEVRAGYMIYDKVLRPAQVTVGKES